MNLRTVAAAFAALGVFACGSSSTSTASSGAASGATTGASSGASAGTTSGTSSGASSSAGASGTSATAAAGTTSGAAAGSTGVTGGSTSGSTVTSNLLAVPGTNARIDFFAEDVDAGQVWVISTGKGNDAGTTVTAIDVFDDATLTQKTTVLSLQAPGDWAGPVADLEPSAGKLFFSGILFDAGCAEIDALDETTHAITPLGYGQGCNEFTGDAVQSLTFDRNARRLYASLSVSGGGGYLYSIDAPSGALITTFTVPDAGWDSDTCAFSSSASCFGENGFGAIAVDLTGQSLYCLGVDQNEYPMAATWVFAGVDGGTLQGVVGGSAGDWETGIGPFAFFDAGAVIVGLKDGGNSPTDLQFLNSYDPPLPNDNVATAGNTWFCELNKGQASLPAVGTIDPNCNLEVYVYTPGNWIQLLQLPATMFPQQQINGINVQNGSFTVEVDLTLGPANVASLPQCNPLSGAGSNSPTIYRSEVPVSKLPDSGSIAFDCQ